MNKLSLRPLLIFTGRYPDDSLLDREGVSNTALLMKAAFFTKRGLNIPEENGCIIENDKFVSANGKYKILFLSSILVKTLLLFIFVDMDFQIIRIIL